MPLLLLTLFLAFWSVTSSANDSKNELRLGAEFNFVRIFLLRENIKTISGTVSIFLPKRNIELAFPFYASTEKDSFGNRYSEGSIDFHFRKYMGPFENFYFSGFVRSSYLKGLDNSLSFVDDEYKYGVGVGFGFRKLFKSGVYWGASFSRGRYIIGENDKFYACCSLFSADSATITDIELLKLGYMF